MRNALGAIVLLSFAALFTMIVIDGIVKTDELRDKEREKRRAMLYALSLPCKNCNNKELIDELRETSPAAGELASR